MSRQRPDDDAVREAARRAVHYMGIRPEYEVLIGYSPRSDQQAVAEVAAAIREVGARLVLIEAPPPALNRAAPAALVSAIKGTDYYIDMGAGPGPHTKDTYIPMFDYGVSMGMIRSDPGFLGSEASLWPGELWIEIHNLVKWRISKSEVDPGINVTFRVTDARGSDLTFKVKCPENLGANIGAEPLSAGWWGAAARPRVLARAGFPPTHMPMGDLQYSGNGTLYVDTTNLYGRTPEPLVFTYENGFCTRIGSSELAERLWESSVGAYKNANRLREMALTLHPKLLPEAPDYDPAMPVPRSQFPAAGVGDFVTALGGDVSVGGVDPSFDHITTVFCTTEGATVTADGEVIIDEGRLLILDDPELREIAARFGDADELLAPARGGGR
jgi:hypothetical protein